MLSTHTYKATLLLLPAVLGGEAPTCPYTIHTRKNSLREEKAIRSTATWRYPSRAISLKRVDNRCSGQHQVRSTGGAQGGHTAPFPRDTAVPSVWRAASGRAPEFEDLALRCSCYVACAKPLGLGLPGLLPWLPGLPPPGFRMPA